MASFGSSALARSSTSRALMRPALRWVICCSNAAGIKISQSTSQNSAGVRRSAPAKPAVPAKADKPKKPKLVRDSFTIPKAEYTVLADLKQRAAKLGTPAKKSEVLRAGIKALAAMGDPAFAAAIAAVPAIKTGRPSKD